LILKKEKSRTIGVLGKQFSIEILEALNGKPHRFSDLKAQCPNDRTRTRRLRELRENGLIKTIIIQVEDRNFIHYILTEKGKRALELVKQLEQ
jgi:DNA-binding HxlR family transcriptional regulator